MKSFNCPDIENVPEPPEIDEPTEEVKALIVSFKSEIAHIKKQRARLVEAVEQYFQFRGLTDDMTDTVTAILAEIEKEEL